MAAALLVAGCTQLSWQRLETTEAQAEADRTECRRIAHNQARRLNETPLFVPYFVTARDDRGRVRSIPVVPWRQFGPPVWWPYAPSLAIDRQSLAHELFRECMEAKGYQLLPVPEPPAAVEEGGNEAPEPSDAPGGESVPAEPAEPPPSPPPPPS